MMNKLLLTILLTFTGICYAQEALETNSFKTIEQKVLAKGKRFGAKRVLVVFDIDNTILTMPQNFGSDQWWGWQSSNCLGKDPLPNFCVTSDFSELLDIQGQIFAISNMEPTEKATVSVVKNLQNKGYKVMLLTSRGPNFRNATQRAIKNNGMDFINSAIGPNKGYPGTYIPYKLKNHMRYGLTKSDMKNMGYKKPRPVSYMNGVFMTAGLNKGIMLKTLLKKTNTKVKAIVFADDHIKHTKSMQKIMGTVKNIDVTTFRYGKIDPIVKAFKESDKKESIDAWTKLKAVNSQVYK